MDFFGDLLGGLGGLGGESSGFFDAFAKFAFGSSEAGGFVEGMAGAGGIFEDLMGMSRGMGAAADVLGAAREGYAAESLFARAMRVMQYSSDCYLDFLLLKDAAHRTGFHEFERSWTMDAGLRTSQEALRDVVKGHGFLLQQLRAHKDKKGVQELLTEYEALGVSLPSEHLLKNVRKKLATFLHPGAHPDDTVLAELFKRMEESHDLLTNTDKRALYEEAVRTNRAGIEEVFSKVAATDWQKACEMAEQQSRLRLTGPHVPPTYNGFRKWLGELSGTQRGAVIFATVAGVGIGAYALAQAMDKPQRRNHGTRWRDDIANAKPPQTNSIG